MLKKSLVFLSFIVLLIIYTYIYRLLYHSLIPWGWKSDLLDLLVIVVYLFGLIPLTAFLSEKLVKYSFNVDQPYSKRFKMIFVTVVVVIPVTLFALDIYHEYREKDLDYAINFNLENVQSLAFYEGTQFEWRTDDEEHVEELIEFLSQYRVKRMSHGEWDGDVSKERGFRFTIHTIKKPIIMTSVYEERVLDLGSGPYRVVNGPVDVDWVERFVEEHQQ
ncbi:hypothetical protein [Alkalibacillus aidingensis]|uniref:hypothetical protein n=1 Tax=Alkalibacillus aidingensis TaxID=2747607 RepID=UPI0016614C12|nr:hypothetical protein [Alkalibacillus aidingensis]